MAQPRSPFPLPGYLEKYRGKLEANTGIVRVQGDLCPDAADGYLDDLAARNPWLIDALADVMAAQAATSTAPAKAPRARRAKRSL